MSGTTAVRHLLILAALVAGVASPAAGETLEIVLDKTGWLNLDRAAGSVVVGKAEVADVTVDSPRLLLITGKSVGETNLLVLDGQGREIVSLDVIVVPEAERHVTINRGAGAVTTWSCGPRCVNVRNPGLEPMSDKPGGGASPTAAAPAARPSGGAAAGSAPAASGGAAGQTQAAPAAQ